MNTTGKILALFSTLALAATAAADVTGLELPGRIDSVDALAAFVVTLVALIAFNDYARSPALPLAITSPHARPLAAAENSTHPLAA